MSNLIKLSYVYTCETITRVKILKIYITPQSFLVPFVMSHFCPLPPQASTLLLSVSIVCSKWNPAICSLVFGLASFPRHNYFPIQPYYYADEVFISFLLPKTFLLNVYSFPGASATNFHKPNGLKQQKCILSTVLAAESPKFQKTTLFPGAAGEKLFLTFSNSWQKCGTLYLLLHHNLCLCGQRASSSSLQVSNQVTIMVFQVHLENPGLSFHQKIRKKKKKRTLFPNKVTFRGFGHYIWMSLGGSFSAYHRMDTPQFFNLHTCCWQLFSVFGYYKYEHS